MPPHTAFRSIALLTAAIARSRSSSAFVSPQSRIGVVRLGSSSRNNNDGDGGGDPLFFDDFGDFDGSSSPSNGGGGNSGMSSILRSRMSQVRGAEEAYDAKLARNWRRGNWGVRGFALDKSSYAATGTTAGAEDGSNDGGPVHVSVVAAPTSASFADVSLPQDGALPADRIVAVGRTDGSVFVVKLGEEYLTNFVSVPKLVVEQGDKNEGRSGGGNDGAAMTVRVDNEWMDAGQLKKGMRDEQAGTMPECPTGGEDGDQTTQKQAPFEIMHQFLATEQGEPIDCLLFDDVVGRNDSIGIVCTSAGGSGDICVWSLPSTDAKAKGVAIPRAALLGGVHSDGIVSLETMVLQSPNADERNVLFSASRDGAFALWDLDRDGELIFSTRCGGVETDGTASLTCADVSNPNSWEDGYDGDGENDNDVILLGMSNGYVFGYVVQELISSAASGQSDCPEPNLRFRAHGTDSGKGEAVTAIKCGGDGTILSSARLRGGAERPTSSGSRSRSLSSFILLTGGEDGSVKQWEILSQKTPSSPPKVRMEHWPRLSSQRMKRRSHLFSPGHDGPVSSIAQQSKCDSSKFLTCGQDGSVCVWSASSGEELFRMDGFSSGISSLACLGRELLVTDGMEGYVCVHDFGIEEDAVSDGYDLEW